MWAGFALLSLLTVSTRMLIFLSLLCGLAILVAFALQATTWVTFVRFLV